MATTFQLDTLKIRMSEAALQRLDLHQRIQRALRALILDGALGPGVKLPATRGLAKSLGVSRDTVENAYVQLHRDGYIVRREGSGSYVSETVGIELRGATRKRATLARQPGAACFPARSTLDQGKARGKFIHDGAPLFRRHGQPI